MFQKFPSFIKTSLFVLINSTVKFLMYWKMFKMFALKITAQSLVQLLKKYGGKFRPFHVDSHKKAAKKSISSFQQVVFRNELREKSKNSKKKVWGARVKGKPKHKKAQKVLSGKLWTLRSRVYCLKSLVRRSRNDALRWICGLLREL